MYRLQSLFFSFNQLPLQLEEKSNAFYKRMRILYMNNELLLNNEYVDELCSEESVSEVIPYLLSMLPITAIPRTRSSNRLVEGLRQDSDSIHAFIKKKCATGPEYTIKKDLLYEAYVEFCIQAGRESHKKHGFMRNMRSLGFTEGRESKNGAREMVWCGITVKKFLKKGGK